MIDDLPPLREVIKSLRLSAHKSLGQNFLLDLNLTARIARLAGSLDDHDIIEIGPGPGGLSRALLAMGARRLILVERDERCRPALEQIASHYPGRVEIFIEDALGFDYQAHIDRPARIIANLPYNIATPLLTGWLKVEPWPPFYDSLTLMFQKEVAERICASPGNKSYGRLAIISQWRCQPRTRLRLPARAFTPPPKVDSAIVHFVPTAPRGEPCSFQALEKVTAAAFGQRRKMLRSSLRQLSAAPVSLLQKAAIAPDKRPEQLSIEQFTQLASLTENG